MSNIIKLLESIAVVDHSLLVSDFWCFESSNSSGLMTGDTAAQGRGIGAPETWLCGASCRAAVMSLGSFCQPSFRLTSQFNGPKPDDFQGRGIGD